MMHGNGSVTVPTDPLSSSVPGASARRRSRRSVLMLDSADPGGRAPRASVTEEPVDGDHEHQQQFFRRSSAGRSSAGRSGSSSLLVTQNNLLSSNSGGNGVGSTSAASGSRLTDSRQSAPSPLSSELSASVEERRASLFSWGPAAQQPPPARRISTVAFDFARRHSSSSSVNAGCVLLPSGEITASPSSGERRTSANAVTDKKVAVPPKNVPLGITPPRRDFSFGSATPASWTQPTTEGAVAVADRSVPRSPASPYGAGGGPARFSGVSTESLTPVNSGNGPRFMNIATRYRVAPQVGPDGSILSGSGRGRRGTSFFGVGAGGSSSDVLAGSSSDMGSSSRKKSVSDQLLLAAISTPPGTAPNLASPLQTSSASPRLTSPNSGGGTPSGAGSPTGGIVNSNASKLSTWKRASLFVSGVPGAGGAAAMAPLPSAQSNAPPPVPGRKRREGLLKPGVTVAEDTDSEEDQPPTARSGGVTTDSLANDGDGAAGPERELQLLRQLTSRSLSSMMYTNISNRVMGMQRTDSGVTLSKDAVRRRVAGNMLHALLHQPNFAFLSKAVVLREGRIDPDWLRSLQKRMPAGAAGVLANGDPGLATAFEWILTVHHMRRVVTPGASCAAVQRPLDAAKASYASAKIHTAPHPPPQRGGGSAKKQRPPTLDFFVPVSRISVDENTLSCADDQPAIVVALLQPVGPSTTAVASVAQRHMAQKWMAEFRFDDEGATANEEATRVSRQAEPSTSRSDIRQWLGGGPTTSTTAGASATVTAPAMSAPRTPAASTASRVLGTSSTSSPSRVRTDIGSSRHRPPKNRPGLPPSFRGLGIKGRLSNDSDDDGEFPDVVDPEQYDGEALSNSSGDGDEEVEDANTLTTSPRVVDDDAERRRRLEATEDLPLDRMRPVSLPIGNQSLADTIAFHRGRFGNAASRVEPLVFVGTSNPNTPRSFLKGDQRGVRTRRISPSNFSIQVLRAGSHAAPAVTSGATPPSGSLGPGASPPLTVSPTSPLFLPESAVCSVSPSGLSRGAPHDGCSDARSLSRSTTPTTSTGLPSPSASYGAAASGPGLTTEANADLFVANLAAELQNGAQDLGSLSIHHTPFTWRQTARLCHVALRLLPTHQLRKLALRFCELDSLAIAPLVAWVAVDPCAPLQLHTLDLADNLLSAKDLPLISVLVCACPALLRLSLRNNPLRLYYDVAQQAVDREHEKVVKKFEDKQRRKNVAAMETLIARHAQHKTSLAGSSSSPLFDAQLSETMRLQNRNKKSAPPPPSNPEPPPHQLLGAFMTSLNQLEDLDLGFTGLDDTCVVKICNYLHDADCRLRFLTLDGAVITVSVSALLLDTVRRHCRSLLFLSVRYVFFCSGAQFQKRLLRTLRRRVWTLLQRASSAPPSWLASFKRSTPPPPPLSDERGRSNEPSSNVETKDIVVGASVGTAAAPSFLWGRNTSAHVSEDHHAHQPAPKDRSMVSWSAAGAAAVSLSMDEHSSSHSAESSHVGTPGVPLFSHRGSPAAPSTTTAVAPPSATSTRFTVPSSTAVQQHPVPRVSSTMALHRHASHFVIQAHDKGRPLTEAMLRTPHEALTSLYRRLRRMERKCDEQQRVESEAKAASAASSSHNKVAGRPQADMKHAPSSQPPLEASAAGAGTPGFESPFHVASPGALALEQTLAMENSVKNPQHPVLVLPGNNNGDADERIRGRGSFSTTRHTTTARFDNEDDLWEEAAPEQTPPQHHHRQHRPPEDEGLELCVPSATPKDDIRDGAAKVDSDHTLVGSRNGAVAGSESGRTQLEVAGPTSMARRGTEAPGAYPFPQSVPAAYGAGALAHGHTPGNAAIQQQDSCKQGDDDNENSGSSISSTEPSDYEAEPGGTHAGGRSSSDEDDPDSDMAMVDAWGGWNLMGLRQGYREYSTNSPSLRRRARRRGRQ